jgi:asparagine synthase (glutamine-hydrolysing)
MSGICGFIQLDGRPADPADLARMTGLLERRGPDGTGHWHEGPVALGHTLLATTPESLNETLPLRHPETACVITADVRLDNRPELLEALGARQRLADAGDGTLLLEAYLRWGESCVDHLLGDFAFAIWDPRRRRLFCARDHMGMRQLIYHHTPGRLFAFATEPRAVLQAPGVPRRLNEVRIADYLANLEHADATSTFFEVVFRLPPAHVLKVDDSGLDLRRYWSLVPGPPLELPSDEAYAEAFLEVFTEAVRCRLRAPPGKLGSMLSGGMDSGSVVAVASQLLAEAGRGPLPTFSAVGPDPETCIETRTIRAAMTIPGIAPHSVDHADLGPWKDDLLRLAMAVDEPFDAHMNLPRAVYLAARRAGLNVMLDGAAGDSVLTHSGQIASLLRGGRWLQAVRDAVGEERFWGPSWPAWRTLAQSARTAFVPQWLRRLRHRVRRHWPPGEQADGGIISATLAGRVDVAGRRAALVPPPTRGRLSHAEERARSITSTSLLVGRERYDRVAAALAIEPRDPFMDLRLTAFCLRLPGAQLQRDGWPKLILRRTMAGRLPDPVRWRRGKEHLGWTFTHTLFSRWATWRHTQYQESQTLSEYIRSDQLPNSLLANEDHVYHLSVADEKVFRSRIEQEVEVAIFTHWLNINASDEIDRMEFSDATLEETSGLAERSGQLSCAETDGVWRHEAAHSRWQR